MSAQSNLLRDLATGRVNRDEGRASIETGADPHPAVVGLQTDVVAIFGQLDSMTATSELFAFAAEPSGSPHSPRALRSHRLDVSGWVVGARLHVAWAYSENLHHRSTVEGLADPAGNAVTAGGAR